MWDQMWMHHLSQVDVDELVKEGRLGTRDGLPEKPTDEEVNVWSIGQRMGHDSINCWICVKARCARNGEEYQCGACKGTGQDPTEAATLALQEAWVPTPPPKGEAYQIWETVSEGSPVTPALSPEDLAGWCEAHQFDNGNRCGGERWNGIAGGTGELSYDQWLAFIVGPGWAPSMVMSEKGIQSGVEFTVAKETT